MRPFQVITAGVDRLVSMSKRATLAPMLLRGLVAVASFAALMVSYPPGTLAPSAPAGFAVLALLPAIWPRGVMPILVILAAALGWLATGSGFDVSGTTFARMCAMAALIYFVHAGATLAAVLPYDAIVTRGVFTPWLLRGVTVLAMTGLLAVFAADLPAFAHGRREVIAAIGGLLVTLAITGYLTLLGRRRNER